MVEPLIGSSERPAGAKARLLDEDEVERLEREEREERLKREKASK